MKRQKAITVDGVRLEPHWLAGYVGEINTRNVRAYQHKDGDWIVARYVLGVTGRTIGGGRTLKAAVAMAKEKVA